MRNNIEKHVKSNIADKPLNEYTALDIQRALSAIPSERMQQIVRQIYNQAFREAVRAGYIAQNPVSNVSGVSHRYSTGRSLTLAEQSEFLTVTSNSPHSRLYKFYLYSGARPSEALSVRWTDITDDTVHIPGTKTELSDRIIPVSKKLRAVLDELPKDREYLFPYTYANVRYHFDREKQKLSFEMTLKDLRHTFGTRCLESGVSMKTVQKWLGHSNYGTTANIYSHITTDFERKELEKLDRSDL